jgi:hypothetical protein
MIKITGLDEVKKELDDLAKNAEALSGKHNIPIKELLSPEFVSKHTKFATVEDMFNASGFKIENQEDFSAIPDDKWDDFIHSTSSFENWKAMLDQAAKDWTVKKLGFK